MSELVAFDERRVALAFSDYLRLIGIANTLEPRETLDSRETLEPTLEPRKQRFAIVLHDDAQLPQAREELEAFVKNPADHRYWGASWETGSLAEKPLSYGGPTFGSQLQHWLLGAGVVTSAVTLLCIAVFIGFMYAPDAVFGALHFPEGLDLGKINGEWWRLLTPALLHFSLLHILFNLIWWRELGGLVERTQSGLQLLGVTLLTAVISNVGQFYSYGPGFGGLSAVVYGLLGYVWLYPKANPAVGFRIRSGIVWLMVGWLLLGYTGAIDVLAGAKVSNNGHLVGLLVGCALGLAFGFINRGKPGRPLV